MKLLHTADWHLGKRLDHFSRLEEQKQVMAEICEIADREAVDAVLIAGDLYDQINPSTDAVELLYQSLHRLAANGKRAVIGIAGNHDSPNRIEAPDPLARACGILLMGYPHTKLPVFELESGLKVLRSDEGFLEVKVPNQLAPLRLIATPYANEIRLKTFLGTEDKEAALREVLQQHWQQLANTYCDDQGVNLLMTHLFLMQKGGERPEEPEDEKPILTVGGAQEVYTDAIPSQVQYAALGHLHRYQVVSESPCPVVYSSSPLAYSMSEAGQRKQVVLIEVEPGQPARFQPIELKQGRPLLRKTFDDLQNAIQWLTEHQDALVELTMVSETYLSAAERKLLSEAHDHIITLIPQVKHPDLPQSYTNDLDLSKSVEALFVDYFQHRHDGQQPNDALMALFREVLAEEEES
ncbi:MAG: exonuclease SbcCD subunit D [Bacteroidota bacterium]